jgi:adenylosuccinate synthase
MYRAMAIRVVDLLDAKALREKIIKVAAFKNKLFTACYEDAEPMDAAAITNEYLAYADRMRSHVCDTTTFFWESMQAGKKLLFEGANGMLLDVDHGTFPYVTSSTTSAIGVPAGAGVPTQTLQTCLGVTKAYTTRVGSGPFPSELKDEIGQYIRDKGHEYGTTTGRPRRCGWFDAVAARYTARFGGLTQIAIMHLDTLTGLDRIGICVGYRTAQGDLPGMVADAALLETVSPVFEYMPGWKEDLRECRRIDQLPAPAREYLQRVESLIGVPVTIVSVGPERNQTLMRAG